MSMKKLRKKSYKMIIIIYDRKTTPTSDRNLVNKISSDKLLLQESMLKTTHQARYSIFYSQKYSGESTDVEIPDEFESKYDYLIHD